MASRGNLYCTPRYSRSELDCITNSPKATGCAGDVEEATVVSIGMMLQAWEKVMSAQAEQPADRHELLDCPLSSRSIPTEEHRLTTRPVGIRRSRRYSRFKSKGSSDTSTTASSRCPRVDNDEDDEDDDGRCPRVDNGDDDEEDKDKPWTSESDFDDQASSVLSWGLEPLTFASQDVMMHQILDDLHMIGATTTMMEAVTMMQTAFEETDPCVGRISSLTRRGSSIIVGGKPMISP